jgi:hypothetical protein
MHIRREDVSNPARIPAVELKAVKSNGVESEASTLVKYVLPGIWNPDRQVDKVLGLASAGLQNVGNNLFAVETVCHFQTINCKNVLVLIN